MGPKLLPPELLFETSLSISARHAVPNVLSSCWILHNFLLHRVIEFKKRIELMAQLEHARSIFLEEYQTMIDQIPEDESREQLQKVLLGLFAMNEIVRDKQVELATFCDMAAELTQLAEVNAKLNILNESTANQSTKMEEEMRKFYGELAKLRVKIAHLEPAVRPDVDQIEDRRSQITARWDNVNSQVAQRARIASEAQQTLMVLRPQYTAELGLLNIMETTINSLQRAEELEKEDLEGQLVHLLTTNAQLQGHRTSIENINKIGNKFIGLAKDYDLKLSQFTDSVGANVKQELHPQVPQTKTGATIVTEELELLNNRFAGLSSNILGRTNSVNELIVTGGRSTQPTSSSSASEEPSAKREKKS